MGGLSALPQAVAARDSEVVEHLTTLDAGFLEVEDSDQNVSLAIGGIVVLDGPPPGYEVLLRILGERMLSNPRSTQVLRTHPLDLAAPEWVEDNAFDLNHHVRRAALPRPGDDAALFGVVADIMERRLDRHRPLWECWVIEGLADDQWAILMKVHHCMADGIAATHFLTAMFDNSDVGSFAGNIRAAKVKPRRGVPPMPSLNPLTWIGDTVRLSTGLAKLAVHSAAGAVEITAGLLRPAAKSALSGPMTDLRRYSAAEVFLDDVAQVCLAFGVTINDVALAAIADSYRAALLRRGQQPRPDSLRTLVPVSVRSNDAMGIPDNRVSAMLPCLPVELADPVQRLQAVHERLDAAKESGQREAASIFVWASNYLPFPLTAWAMRLLTRLPQRGIVTVATNVPGPRQRVRVMGHDVLRLLPIPPIALQLRTGVAILSYADKLVFGVTVDYDAAPDVNELAQGIHRAVGRLVAASTMTEDAEPLSH